jgi:hypothetical protein
VTDKTQCQFLPQLDTHIRRDEHDKVGMKPKTAHKKAIIAPYDPKRKQAPIFNEQCVYSSGHEQSNGYGDEKDNTQRNYKPTQRSYDYDDKRTSSRLNESSYMLKRDQSDDELSLDDEFVPIIKARRRNDKVTLSP